MTIDELIVTATANGKGSNKTGNQLKKMWTEQKLTSVK